jgi:hypothetical protein
LSKIHEPSFLSLFPSSLFIISLIIIKYCTHLEFLYRKYKENIEGFFFYFFPISTYFTEWSIFSWWHEMSNYHVLDVNSTSVWVYFFTLLLYSAILLFLNQYQTNLSIVYLQHILKFGKASLPTSIFSCVFRFSHGFHFLDQRSVSFSIRER